ncbi:SGNH/GDSL hydrolase family protein [Salinimicrobium oceani]|uniref:SGNH/GDSL hydrolase family protein n=1 Tax=Salinimicrobium oceani TaxID=2722702 RepID=A0ABX1CY73_9FLAO|nr:SGNH/GDSL hydrolase family protein [Salinimicrobium oceani]NJW51763.1 SGNH/GDSL hydrolase family protein [Salinimicrobium oceani]
MKKMLLPCLVLLLLMTGCKETEPENITVVEEDTFRYLALGDSYTIGESVAPAMRWPVQLVDSLRKTDVKIEDPRIIATTGWTTQDLLKAMDDQLNNEKFDLVSVLIGVNNQYQGKSLTAYEQDLHEIFERAIARSEEGAAGVFAVSIPDYGATPFGASREEEIGKEIDEFNEVFKKIASEYNIEYFNITPISRRAKEEPELVAEDGLHPSGEMYKQWVDLIFNDVKAILAPKD